MLVLSRRHLVENKHLKISLFLGHEHELYMKVYWGHRWREPEGGFPKDFNAHNQTADDGSELADSLSLQTLLQLDAHSDDLYLVGVETNW